MSGAVFLKAAGDKINGQQHNTPLLSLTVSP
jgi:hypothetical protein